MVEKFIHKVNSVAYGDGMSPRDTLSAIDWIQASFRALTKGGPQAIKVEAIAKDLGVSKGSFYWHFKDVGALKKAMLEHWLEIATDSIVQRVQSTSEKPREQLLELISIATSDIAKPYGGRLAEPAIREWARYDSDAADTLAIVDRRRLKFLRSLFKQLGIPGPLSSAYASGIYGAIIGVEQLSKKVASDKSTGLMCMLDLMLKSSKS
ncbi:MAG: TetR/AcrR family transcriptional regulator [Granulosicoccus sp.]